jgi:hypothetical protein
MMRSWFRRNARTIVITSAAISVVTHATLITAWVIGTLPAPELPPGSIANKVFYIPASDRVLAQPGNRKSISYVNVPAPGEGTGEGTRLMGDARPTVLDQSLGRTTVPSEDSVTAEAVAPTEGRDSVYSVLDVDTAVARMATSAAPAYPLSLLKAHVQGYVNARYIVDTTGFADTASFEVLAATHREFITAVKEALPFMRFQPAKIGPMKVKQLVQQQFSFKITDTLPGTKKP